MLAEEQTVQTLIEIIIFYD